MEHLTKPELKIAGAGFERSLGGVLDMYLVVDDDGLCISIANPTSRRFLAFEQWRVNNPNQQEIQNAIGRSELLNAVESFRKAVCVVQNDQSVFIPDPLFDPQTLDEQLHLCLGPAPSMSKSGYDKLPMLGVVNCHYYNKPLIDTLTSKFKQLQLEHAASLRLLYMASVSGPSKDPLVIIDVYQPCMQITVTKGSALLFHNKFEFQTPEELTYYLLLVFEQLKLEPENTDVFFTGNIDKENPSFSLACKYITRCRLAGLPSVFTYEPEFSFLSGSRHFNLFCGPLCVS